MKTTQRPTASAHGCAQSDRPAVTRALRDVWAKTCIAAALAIAVFASAVTSVHASTIVVANDEWTLTDTGFANAPDTQRFVSNLVQEFGPRIHAYSYNRAFFEPSLATAMSAAGATFTVQTNFPFDFAHLSQYDGLLLGGYYLLTWEMDALKQYVANGGNVYLAVGTGLGVPEADALLWAPFLDPYGISIDHYQNHIVGTIPVSGDPLFDGVSGLYQNSGTSLSGDHIVCCGNQGLYAVVRDVPEPATLPLVGAGMLVVAMVLRRRAA
jgi:hypothetical protein